MAFRIEWLESAQNDLDKEISYVLGNFGRNTARKAYLKITENISKLAEFPLTGTLYEGVTYNGCEIYKLPLQQTTVFYSVQTNLITILAVWNNYKDPARIPYQLMNLE